MKHLQREEKCINHEKDKGGKLRRMRYNFEIHTDDTVIPEDSFPGQQNQLGM